MDASVSYRPPVQRDEEEIARLCGELGYPSASGDVAERLRAIVDADDHFVLVAAGGDDEPVGWIHACVVRRVESDPFVEIGGMVVSSVLRGRGIGGRLLAAAESWARSRDATAIRVRSNVVRERAHAFYLGAGYLHSKTSLVLVKKLR